MKQLKAICVGIVFVLGFSFILYAQEAATEATSSSDLETLLQALTTTTPLPASQAPVLASGFYSFQNPDWPPLPGNVLGLDVWPLWRRVVRLG